MKEFTYSLSFSPYQNSVFAKNRKEAWQKIVSLWGRHYDCDKVVTLH